MEILAVILAYFIGSLPTAYLIGKWKLKIDVRYIGTKNMGATNITKLLGTWWGILVFAIDFSKSILAYLLAFYLFDVGLVWSMAASVASVLGHNYPVWLKFHGGKGAATAGGAFAIYTITQGYLWQAIIFLIILIIAFIMLRNWVVGAIVAFILIPFAYLIDGNTAGFWFAAVLLIVTAIKFVPSAWNDILDVLSLRYFKRKKLLKKEKSHDD
ncbi:MAG: glycerol-3-phosphate acyltransferase [Chloroflexi bacterium]|nr:glycerol-3-phosphate acyltransferase [Chloroflexota bacterium]